MRFTCNERLNDSDCVWCLFVCSLWFLLLFVLVVFVCDFARSCSLTLPLYSITQIRLLFVCSFLFHFVNFSLASSLQSIHKHLSFNATHPNTIKFPQTTQLDFIGWSMTTLACQITIDCNRLTNLKNSFVHLFIAILEFRSYYERINMVDDWT